MRRSVLCAATVVAVGVLVGGCHTGYSAEGSGRLTSIAGPIQPVVSTLDATTGMPSLPSVPSTPLTSPPSTVTRSAGALPVRLSIPAIDAVSSLIPLGLNRDDSVQVPPVSTPMQAGWFDGGAAPGEPGPAVLLGHVDGDRQAGIFFRLHELTPGAQVLITRADGSVVRFTVTKVVKVAKGDFPTQAVYGPTADPELRLVTCGGTFDSAAHSYVDNVIVYATLS